MKTIGKKFTTLFLVLAIMLSGLLVFNTTKREKAYALTNQYQPVSNMDNVYYFSDSSPSRQNMLGNPIGLYVYYDAHYYITPQEFNFMVFSGYFWELTYVEDANVLAIFEFKTMKPDQQVLENLFSCLMEHGVKVMFISCYLEDYSFSYGINDSNCYESMYCNADQYAFFLRHSFRSMIFDYYGFQNNTTLLVDGRYAGINSSQTEYNLGELCYYSPILRRIVNYSRFGYAEDDELYFEEDLFKDVWLLYYNTYFAPFVSALPDYFSNLDVSMDEFYQAWFYMRENQEQLSAEDIEQYNEEYAMAFDAYYAEIASDLESNNIHILLNVESNIYVDILSSSPSEFTMNNYTDIFNITPGIDYLFALAIWPWSPEYSGLFADIVDNLSNIENNYSSNITEFPIYLWSDEEIPFDLDGIPVFTAEYLWGYFGAEYRFPQADEGSLDDEFLGKLYSLLAIDLGNSYEN